MQRDWIGEWFRVFEDLGENVDILCGQVRLADGSVKWTRFSHTEVDGYGALLSMFESHGGTVKLLPKYRGRTPLLPERIFAFWRYLRMRPQLEPTLVERFEAQGPPAGVAWAVLGEKETQAMREAAHADGVSSNTRMVWAINRAVAAQKLATNKIPAWLVPVNLRGAVRAPHPKANHSTFISVSIPDGAAPKSVEAVLREQLQRGAQFGAWVAMNLGKVIGLEKYKTRTRGLVDKPFGWTGVFSNLGNWTEKEMTMPASLAGPWIGCPPTSRKVPISCGCIIFEGRLGVGVQIHPSLARGEAPVRALIERFVEELAPGSKATFGFTPWSALIAAS